MNKKTYKCNMCNEIFIGNPRRKYCDKCIIIQRREWWRESSIRNGEV